MEMHFTGKKSYKLSYCTLKKNNKSIVLDRIFRTSGYFLRLVRWPNLLMIIVIQIALYYVLIERVYNSIGLTGAMGVLDLSILVLTTVFIAAAGYIINDYYDIDTDTINKPDKQLIGLKITPRTGIISYYTLNVLAILGGFYLAIKADSWRIGLLSAMVIILLWLYSTKYKRTVLVGNFAVAFMAAMSIIVIWLFEFFMLRKQPSDFVSVSPYLKMITWYFTGYSVFSFLLTLCREVIKDAEDIQGDGQSGMNTLAVRHGIKASKLVASIIAVIAIILGIAASISFLNNNMSLVGIYFMIAVVAPLMYMVFKILSAKEKSDFHTISLIAKVIMIAGILALQPIAMS